MSLLQLHWVHHFSRMKERTKCIQIVSYFETLLPFCSYKTIFIPKESNANHSKNAKIVTCNVICKWPCWRIIRWYNLKRLSLLQLHRVHHFSRMKERAKCIQIVSYFETLFPICSCKTILYRQRFQSKSLKSGGFSFCQMMDLTMYTL